jgi:dihydrodipicolinate synthase/N-acetylneuraminate lyase
VAEHIPVMLVTNYLGARGTTFGLELCRRLCHEAPGVVALKDDVGGEFACKVCLATHDRWALSAGGLKQNHLLMLPYGVDGYLSLFINFKPEIAWRYWRAIEAGDLLAARGVVRDYDLPLFDYILKSEGGFDAAIHGIYELFGLAKRCRRPPYHTLTDKQMGELADVLRKLKIR